MQLTEEVARAGLDVLVGSEILISNRQNSPSTILRATITGVRVIGSFATISFACKGVVRGTLDDNLALCEEEPMVGNSVTIIGSTYEVEKDGSLLFTQSSHGTVVRLLPATSTLST